MIRKRQSCPAEARHEREVASVAGHLRRVVGGRCVREHQRGPGPASHPPTSRRRCVSTGSRTSSPSSPNSSACSRFPTSPPTSRTSAGTPNCSRPCSSGAASRCGSSRCRSAGPSSSPNSPRPAPRARCVLRALRRPAGRSEGVDRNEAVRTRAPNRQYRGGRNDSRVPGRGHALPGRLADLRALVLRRQVAHRGHARCRRCPGREGHSSRRQPEGRARQRRGERVARPRSGARREPRTSCGATCSSRATAPCISPGARSSLTGTAACSTSISRFTAPCAACTAATTGTGRRTRRCTWRNCWPR